MRASEHDFDMDGIWEETSLREFSYHMLWLKRIHVIESFFNEVFPLYFKGRKLSNNFFGIPIRSEAAIHAS